MCSFAHMINGWNLTFRWHVKISLFSTGKNKRNEKRNKTEDPFIKLKQTFRITRTLKSSSWDKGDNNQRSYRWLKYVVDPFFISTVETLSSELRFKKCFGAAILLKKSTGVFAKHLQMTASDQKNS